MTMPEYQNPDDNGVVTRRSQPTRHILSDYHNADSIIAVDQNVSGGRALEAGYETSDFREHG